MADLDPMEATVADIRAAHAAGTTTCRAPVEWYLARIEAFDRSGPGINSVITVDPDAVQEGDVLDAPDRTAGGSSGGSAAGVAASPAAVPGGLAFLGRPFEDGAVPRWAHAPERATRHRRPPPSAPPLGGRRAG